MQAFVYPTRLLYVLHTLTIDTSFLFIGQPVINFTHSVYDVNEDRKVVVGIFVTQNKVIAPLTVRCVIFHCTMHC